MAIPIGANLSVLHCPPRNRKGISTCTKCKVIWDKMELLLISICQVAAAICNWRLQVGVWPPNLPFLQGFRVPHLTECVIELHKCTCQMASKSVERFKQGARMWQTDDKQTDHAMEKCKAIGRIACAAKKQFCQKVVSSYEKEWTRTSSSYFKQKNAV